MLIATKKISKSLAPRCAVRSRRSGALINLISHHVMVDSGLPDLNPCASLVVPELRGGGG
jgi:hypothetical protein